MEEKLIENCIEKINGFREAISYEEEFKLAAYCLEMAMLELSFALAKRNLNNHESPPLMMTI